MLDHAIDFTEVNYKHMISNFLKSHKSGKFMESGTSPIFVCRHDVDFSPHRSLRIAQIENELGISAYYFVLLRSNFYSLLERKISQIFQEIIKLGHIIGLHLDISDLKVCDEEQLCERISFEKNIINTELNVEINTFAFHNTNEQSFKFKKSHYMDLLNVYSDQVMTKYKYCSDSNGYWRFSKPETFRTENLDRDIQLLTHPAWWTADVMQPAERIERCINGRAEYVYLNYQHKLMLNKRENIGANKILKNVLPSK